VSEPAITVINAASVSDADAHRLSVLLGRAYTDQRHIDRYTAEEHAELSPHIARIHSVHPTAGETMPPDWLDHFPTLRNFKRQPAERREAFHFVAESGGYLAAHVSLWAQRFLFEGEYLNGGYIEDVATDPLHLGQGLATAAMQAATGHAKALKLDLLGLATGIGPFYERLGWRTWQGSHLFSVIHLEYPDEPLMLLPLTAAGERFAATTGGMRSRRLWRFGEIPNDWP
jgi:predicted N-acetyltransferase YhbS